MAKDGSLRDIFELFYGEIIENYKMAQRMVMSESTLRSIFKKSNYSARISDFAKVKKAVINLEIKKSEDYNDLENDLIDSLNSSRDLLKDICDAQIALQQTLKAKADKERKISIKEYSKIMNDVRAAHDRLQKGLHNLDIFYSDWLEEQ